MLTGHGRHLVDAGSRLLTDLEEIESGLHRQAGHRRRANCGSPPSPPRCAAWSPRPCATCVARIPTSSLALTEREPWDTIDLVASGQGDLGVVHSWGDVPLAIPDHLATTPLARDLADVVMPAGHRLAGRHSGLAARPGRRGLDRHPRGHDLPPVADPDVRRHRPAPRIAHQSMEFDSHLALVRAGLGIALIPRLGRQPLPTTWSRSPRTTRSRPARSWRCTGGA